MWPLIILFIFAGILVYVIWKFTNAKSTTYGIDVVTGEGSGISDREIDEEVSVESKEKLTKLAENENTQRGELKKLDSSVEDECIQAIIKNPKDINLYLRLSVFYIQRKKWNDAKEVLLEAKKIDENNEKVLNNLGIIWYKLKRYNNAVSAFEESLKQNDKIAHRHVNLGLCFNALGENNKAAEYFSNAVALDPEHRDYQELLAEAKSMLV